MAAEGQGQSFWLLFYISTRVSLDVLFLGQKNYFIFFHLCKIVQKSQLMAKQLSPYNGEKLILKDLSFLCQKYMPER